MVKAYDCVWDYRVSVAGDECVVQDRVARNGHVIVRYVRRDSILFAKKSSIPLFDGSTLIT